MDLHVPEAPIRSVKDFLLHIGIVTVGILIALGLEQLVEARHRVHVASDAVHSFRDELRDDREQVREVLDAMPKLRATIDEEIARLDGPPARGSPRATIHYPGVYLDLVSSASWDTAIATQALTELPYASVKPYAEAYGVLRLFLDAERSGLDAWESLRRFGSDPAALSPEQRRALVEQLRRYESHTYLIEMIGKSALQSCERALGDVKTGS